MVESARELYRRGRQSYYQFRQLGDPALLDAAIECFAEAVGRTADRSRDWPIFVGGLGAALLERAGSDWGSPADLDNALACFEQALSATPPDSPDRFKRLHNHGFALLDRYQQRGNERDLEAAIRDLGEAVHLASGEQGLAATCHGLGRALLEFWRLGGAADIDETIPLLRQAVELSPAQDRIDLPAYLNDLGSGLLARHQHTGSGPDLAEAIGRFREAVRLAGPRERPGFHNGLGAALRLRHEHDGRAENLHDAIAEIQQAVDECQEPRQQAGYRGNLGCALQDRYQRLGDLGDLEEAIRLFRDAVRHTPDGSPELALRLDNLGQGLHARHRLNGKPSDVDEAVECFEKAVRSTPAGSRDLAVRHNNLGLGLHDRYVLHRDRQDRDAAGGDRQDLDAAVRAFRSAAAGAGVGARAAYLNNLGSCLLERHASRPERHAAGSDLADLEEAVECCSLAVELTPADSPDRPVRLGDMALALREHYKRTESPADLDQAVEAFRTSATASIGMALSYALTITREWAGFATDREAWPEAATAARLMMQAWQGLVDAQLALDDKQTRLRDALGLPAVAGYALARAGFHAEAALALERGRAVVLSERLRYDSSVMTDLEAAGRKDLADRLQNAATRLRGLQRGPGARDTASASWRQLLRDAASQLDAAIAAVHDAGFADLTRPVTFGEIVQAAEPHPVVYLAATPLGGFALTVLPGGAIEPAWLPLLTPTALTEPCRRYFETYAAYLDRRVPLDAWKSALDEILAWLSDAGIGRVLEPLLPARHVVLIPGGILGLLPLHAAYEPEEHRELVIKYAPNAQTLLVGRRKAEEVSADRALVVATGDGLPAAEHEVRRVRAIFSPPGGPLPASEPPDADLLAAMGEYPVLHFACHGSANLSEPLRSCLFLPGGRRLTLHEVMEQRLHATRLAVLAACEASLPGVRLPDEVVGLPTGFLAAGAAAAIGPLWPVDDLSTMALMVRFYETWRTSGVDPAVALARAQQWLRTCTNDELHGHFPEVPGLAPHDKWTEQFRSAWAATRRRAHPYYWAAFTYVGA